MKADSLPEQLDAGTAFTPPIDPAAAEVLASETKPELDEAEQNNRRKEIVTRVAQMHAQAGRIVVQTEVLQNGTTVDWVDRTTVAGANVTPPPPLKLQPLPPGVKLAELQKLSGPPGTLPYIRPTFEAYVKGQAVGRNLDDYLSKLPTSHPAELPAPNNNRLYVSNGTTIANYGANAQFNQFWTGVQIPTGTDFAIGEIAVFCMAGGAVSDMIGPILGYHPAYSGAVFGLERFIGGIQRWVTPANLNGFVQTNPNWAPGMNITGSSTVGGAQYENQLGVYYYSASASAPAAWWVSLNGYWIGYFPATLFTALGSSACNVNFYEEMYDASSSTTTWMNTDMTSGKRPPTSSVATNFQQTGNIRLPVIVRGANNAWGSLPSTNSSLLVINDPYCYDGRWTTDGDAPGSTYWNPTLWLGGPGGNGPGCNADPGGHFGFLPQDGAYVCSHGCTQCGGSGCGSAGTQPGDLCCSSNITSSGRDCMTDFAPCKIKSDDPECRTGVLDASRAYCCGTGCAQCGGGGCATNPSWPLCSGSMPPCKIDPPPKNP